MDNKVESTKTSGQAQPRAAHENGQSQNGQAEQDMLYRLKGAIDQNGRYSYRLNDMAIGYAAGADVPAMSARHKIEQKFNAQFGMTPKEYLENQFAQRDELKNGIAQESTRSRSRGR